MCLPFFPLVIQDSQRDRLRVSIQRRNKPRQKEKTERKSLKKRREKQSKEERNTRASPWSFRRRQTHDWVPIPRTSRKIRTLSTDFQEALKTSWPFVVLFRVSCVHLFPVWSVNCPSKAVVWVKELVIWSQGQGEDFKALKQLKLS